MLVRADASAAIGTGHVMRCLAVAEALAELGSRVVFATAEIPDPLAARLEAGGFPRRDLAAVPGSAADRAALCRLALEWEAAAVILDGYGFDAGYRRDLRARVAPVLAFDDLADEAPLSADLVVNAAPAAAGLDYQGIAPGARMLLGPAFAPLRREIRDAARRPRAAAETAKHLLVSFGGSDPLGLTAPVCRGLAEALEGGARLVAVVGGASGQGEAVRAVAAAYPPGRIDCAVDVRDMGALMAESGMAVAASGGTAAELAALGVPSVLCVVADNQRPSAEAYAAAGAACALDARRADAVPALVAAAAALWDDRGTRAAMSRAARALVDGEGAGRIARALLAAIAAGRQG